MSAIRCGLATTIAAPLQSAFDLANIAMLFLLAVVVVSVRYGLGPSFMASFLNVLAFDFFYVPPRFSFSVSDVQYLVTFSVILTVGLVTAKLTTGLKYQTRVAVRREQRVSGLYEISRDLSGTLLIEKIAEIGQRFIEVGFSADSAILLTDDKSLIVGPVALNGRIDPLIDIAIAQ